MSEKNTKIVINILQKNSDNERQVEQKRSIPVVKGLKNSNWVNNRKFKLPKIKGTLIKETLNLNNSILKNEYDL